jgi:hypothetical protein
MKRRPRESDLFVGGLCQPGFEPSTQQMEAVLLASVSRSFAALFTIRDSPTLTEALKPVFWTNKHFGEGKPQSWRIPQRSGRSAE